MAPAMAMRAAPPDSAVGRRPERHHRPRLADMGCARAGGGAHNPALAGSLDCALLRKPVAMGQAPASAEIMLCPGPIRGPKATCHERKGDALSEEVRLRLPARLRNPQAVLLDTRRGRLLYLLRSEPERLPQLALALEHMLRVDRTARQASTIISAHETSAGRIGQRLRDGSLILI